MRYLLPVGLSALALAVLGVGLPFSHRFRQPARYIFGMILIALGLISFWLLQAIISATVEQRELLWVLQPLAILISISLVGGGLEAVSKANNTRRDDFYDGLFG